MAIELTYIKENVEILRFSSHSFHFIFNKLLQFLQITVQKNTLNASNT